MCVSNQLFENHVEHRDPTDNLKSSLGFFMGKTEEIWCVSRKVLVQSTFSLQQPSWVKLIWPRDDIWQWSSPAFCSIQGIYEDVKDSSVVLNLNPRFGFMPRGQYVLNDIWVFRGRLGEDRPVNGNVPVIC